MPDSPKTEYAKAILSRQPRIVLCEYDTPLQRLSRLEPLLGLEHVYIKRDDLNGVGPGGNKVRALEYLLARAEADNADVVIASGQADSNLCTLTAASCRKRGLRCLLVHNSGEPACQKGNMILNKLLGVERIFIGEKSEQERNHFVAELAAKIRSKGGAPFVIENGATTPLGAVGYAHLPVELSRSPAHADIKRLFVAGGNGGLAAGIIFGNIILGCPYHIHVITVENTVDVLRQTLKELLGEMAGLLDVDDAGDIMKLDSATIHGDYRGGGWAVSTPESDMAVYDLAQSEGIFLEKIYTGKTFWGMTDLLRKNDWHGACLVHSGGFGSLFRQFA